jgi:hypothetical protein
MMLASAPPVAGAAAAVALASALLTLPVTAQQVPDTAFRPDVGPPAYADGLGPRVALDEGHVNFHTLEGRYATFARLLASDGFRLQPSTGALTAETLDGVDVLVIANALDPRNEDDWSLPTPSAFTPDAIGAVRTWVEGGGALLLIADHMPFPGAAADLAAAFGFALLNGFATEGDVGGPIVFRSSDGSLGDHPVTRGSRGARTDPAATFGEQIDSVATFTGHAFRVPERATSLLTFRQGAYSLNPHEAWAFDENTPRTDVSGWSQGALLEVARGRVAVFGEAAMFSAQLAGPQAFPVGMNTLIASQNARLLVNLVRWLAAESEGAPPDRGSGSTRAEAAATPPAPPRSADSPRALRPRRPSGPRERSRWPRW